MSNKDINIHIGGNFDDAQKRITDAWHRVENGEDVNEHHITFANWDLLAHVMTEKRYELLRHIHKHPAESIASLAREVHRDYKRVYEDVHILESAGLLDRRAGMLCADYNIINSSIQL